MEPVIARRLHEHRLEGEPLTGVTEVVGHLLAVQAQEYAASRWSIGQRATSVTEADVDAALASGEVLRTHVLRDTWHLVARDDLRWLLDLTAPRILARNRTMHRREGLDDATLDQGDALIADALQGGRELTRTELQAALADGGIPDPKGFRLAYLVMHAELTSTICSGALRGKQHTYALLDDRAPAAEPLEHDAALERLGRRFLAAHQPAAAEDLARWASLTLTDARRALEHTGAATETIGDHTAYALPGASQAATIPPRAHLLQGYDEYVNGYLATRVTGPIGDGTAVHLVIDGGRLAARWKATRTGKRLSIELQALRPDADPEAVADAQRRYAAFTGLALA